MAAPGTNFTRSRNSRPFRGMLSMVAVSTETWRSDCVGRIMGVSAVTVTSSLTPATGRVTSI